MATDVNGVWKAEESGPRWSSATLSRRSCTTIMSIDWSSSDVSNSAPSQYVQRSIEARSMISGVYRVLAGLGGAGRVAYVEREAL